jgi:hypothetical protein
MHPIGDADSEETRVFGYAITLHTTSRLALTTTFPNTIFAIGPHQSFVNIPRTSDLFQTYARHELENCLGRAL